MKTYIKIYITLAIIGFLGFAFYQATFDITKWPKNERLVCALACLLFGAVVSAIIAGILSDFK